MKLAAWLVGTFVTANFVVAGALRAAPPTSVMSQPGKNWRQSGPAFDAAGNQPAGHWEAYQAAAAETLTTDQGEMLDESPAHDSQVYDSQQYDPQYHDGQHHDAQLYDPHLADPPAFPYSSGNWWRDGCWYGSFDFVVWHRTRPGELILGVDVSQDPAARLNENLNKQGSALGVEPGARATLGRFLHRDLDNRDHSMEFTYLGFNNFSAPDGIVSDVPRSLFTPLDPNYGGFNAADSYDTFYRSSLHTFELNYRLRNRPGRDRMVMGPDGFWSRKLTPGRTQSLLVGLRALSIDENYRFLSLRDGVDPDVFSGDYTVNTDNNLLGMQIGGDCYSTHDDWFWAVRGNAGFYCNFAEGFARIAVNDPQNPEDLVQNQAHSQAAAFYGELSFVIGMDLTENIMLRASYDMALAGGIAMAPDQVSFNDFLADNSPNLSTGGVIFYNGLSVGLEAYW